MKNRSNARFVTLSCMLSALAAVSAAAGFPANEGHLVTVPDTPKARAALAQSNARTIEDYGAFILVEASGADVDRLVAAGADLRDDMREVRIGPVASDLTRARPSLAAMEAAALTGSDGYGLAVVQYVGPLKDAWVKAVEATGVTVVSYLAQNAQLVSGDAGDLAALGGLAASRSYIRAVAPYGAADKRPASLRRRNGRTEVTISTVATKAGEAAAAEILRFATRRSDPVPVLAAGVVQHRVSIDAARLDAIAQMGGVVSMERWLEPELHDERAARIVDGALDASHQPVLGPGHRTFLTREGFTNNSPVLIDITDSGVDKGVVPAPAASHPDFHRLGAPSNPSRIVYAQEATSDPDARDCGGHGTNVASIATGYSFATGASAEDAQGFNYGMGMQPFGRLGATKVFRCDGVFEVATSFAALRAAGFAAGARISNNSWGTTANGAYTAMSQQFDALVRDAQPGTPGNQQYTEVFSAGNTGEGSRTIAAPGTAKNVITVGASESVRAAGTDNCGVGDAGADSARDVVTLSSRGPTADGRIKPDVVAPGTHVTGAQPQVGGDYTGSGTCMPQFPPGSTLYTLGSRTSQAAPAATGVASLIRTRYEAAFPGGVPSPAMVKAMMINTATDLVGGNDGAGGINPPVPTQVQGWGRVNLGNVLDETERRVDDQTPTFTASGEARNRFFSVADPAKTLRVTLVWTDAPGPGFGNAFVNDLDLEVTAGGETFKGNVFAGGRSVTGGTADPRNNVENVFLPPGTTGRVKVRVIAKNIPGDGVPGNADSSDQDYALVVSNVRQPTNSAAVLEALNVVLDPLGDGDDVLEPGEQFTLRQRLKNVGSSQATNISGALSGSPADAMITQPNATWPNLAPNASVLSDPLLRGRIRPATRCGEAVGLDLAVSHNGGSTVVPLVLQTGSPQPVHVAVPSSDVPKAIPDDNPTGIASTVVVTAGAGLLSDVNATIASLTHSWVGDLAIDLTSPSGTTVQLFRRAATDGSDNLSNTVFDDAAATSILDAAAPFSGAFRPVEPLSRFNGEPASGTWTLRVRDLAPLDTGTVQGWNHSRKRFVCD